METFNTDKKESFLLKKKGMAIICNDQGDEI